jgi:transposase-like protein
MQLCKIITTRGHAPSEEAPMTLLWRALRHVLGNKVRSAKEWREAMSQVPVMYDDRFTELTP